MNCDRLKAGLHEIETTPEKVVNVHGPRLKGHFESPWNLL